MDAHVYERDVLALLRGSLPKERVAAVSRHVESCPDCVKRAVPRELLDTSAESLLRQIADVDHPDLETTLTQFVEGELGEAETAAVDAHLAACERCRVDLQDLRSIAELPAQPFRRVPRLLFVAATLILALYAVQTFRDRSAQATAGASPTTASSSVRPAAIPPVTPAAPAPAHRTYGRAAWDAAVSEAVASGTIAMPAVLAELQLAPQRERSPASSSSTAQLTPSATIVDETRPLFHWSEMNDAVYVVSIFDGRNPVAESPRIARAEWQPPRALDRGKTYQWQVEVLTGETSMILPAPPAPPAFFRILDLSSHDELTSARDLHGDDPLLLGVLYASKGLREDAERELAKLDTPDGRKLLHSIRNWRS